MKASDSMYLIPFRFLANILVLEKRSLRPEYLNAHFQRNQNPDSVFAMLGGSMRNRWSRGVTVLGVAALLSMGSVSAVAADRCERRVRKAEMQLQQAVQRHGEHSRQAQKKRRNLEQIRATCHQ
jgi:hypothetical protein